MAALRLARSLKSLIGAGNELDERDVGFRSLIESFNPTTLPGGHLVVHIFGALAKFERELIRELSHARPGRGSGTYAGAAGCSGGKHRPACLSENAWMREGLTPAS